MTQSKKNPQKMIPQSLENKKQKKAKQNKTKKKTKWRSSFKSTNS